MRMLAAALTLLLALGLSAPAAAAPDLASVTIEIATVRASGKLESLTAAITVDGERIVRVDLTPPGGTTVALPLEGSSFVLERTFTSEQELVATLPDGAWRLTLNGSTEVEFDFELTPVPSPAISAPLPGEILVPGAVTVAFTRCLACTQDTDSTEAEIADADGFAVASALLEPDDESWSPLEELDEDSSFTAVIVHTAERTQDLVSTAGDAFALLTRVAHTDAVAFFTGAASPSGSFCIAVAMLDPPDTCLAIDDESAALIDPSGEFALSVGGVDIAYEAELGAGGAIGGTARADLDGNGSLETSAPLRGKLEGFLGKVERRIAFDFRSAAPAAKLAVRIHELASVELGAIGGRQRAKGTLLGAKLKEDAPSSLPLGGEPIGWRLDVSLAGKHVEDASIELEDGRVFALRGRFAFDFLTDLGKLDLRSEGEDAGVQVRIEDLRADLESQPPVFDSGDFTFKVLGQRGRINPLP